MLNVILPCCKGDEHQAVWLLEWIAELGRQDTLLVILCSEECDVENLTSLGEKAFTQVKWARDSENIKSDWRAEGLAAKSAAGPNSLFRQACWYFALNDLGPWLWLEPDAVPCRQDWLQLIDSEYSASGKPFMGFLVNMETHPGKVAVHMSGVGVYPPNTPSFLQKCIIGNNMAFDVMGASVMVPRMKDTSLIFHRYRPPGFEIQEDFDVRVSRDVAIWHACKDGSIYPFLRNRLFGTKLPAPPTVPVAQRIELPVSTRKVEGSTPSGHVVDIYIKTCQKDADWLEWCMKSIDKFASGFRRIHVEGDTEDAKPGYLWQQSAKLHADLRLMHYFPNDEPPEFILYMDSDCVFTRPVTPDEFIKDGKPVWLYTPFGESREDQKIWGPVMEKFLGERSPNEQMRRHPFLASPWALRKMRSFCEEKHGISLSGYIMAQAVLGAETALVFSEWNCLGAFLWKHHHDKIHWVLDSEAGPACVHQGHTWEGEKRKAQDIAKFKEILGEPSGDVVHATQGEPAGIAHGIGETHSLTIDSAIEFLAAQATTNPLKGLIVRKLKKAWKETNVSFKKPKPVREKVLMAIHSYPGANETVARHWPQFLKAGADRIVGIGTTDGGCEFPCESVNIGENAYMKLKGKDDHLCRRLLDTVKWCLTQPEDRYIIAEYDTIFLKKFPSFKGINAYLTGGKVNGAKSNQFHHNPHCFDREAGTTLVSALEAVLPDSQTYPDNSPDLFFGLACERAGIKVGCTWKMFTRNSLDAPGDLDLAVEAARDGVHVIHGVKRDYEYNSIMEALNGKHLELSHVA